LKPDRMAQVSCGTCSNSFLKRKDTLKPVNFCSKVCYSQSRRRADAKWRDPEQIRAYMKIYAAENLARRRIYQARTRKNNKAQRREAQRVRRSSRAATREQIKRLFERAQGLCVYCGKQAALELDHILAVSLGGKNRGRNMLPCCRSCNGSKGIKDVADWVYEKHGVLGLARALTFIERNDKPAVRAALYPHMEAV